MNKEFIQFLSEARLDRYRLPTDTPALTLDRYQWNVRLAEAMMPALGYVEIGLRNHMNILISQIFGDKWLLSPPRELRLRQNDMDRIRAIHNELRHERKSEATNDDVVVRMNFGFWCSLFQKQYDTVLWQKHGGLTVVFPHLPHMERSRQQISPKLQLVRFARNCIAHHEPIWDLEPDIKTIHGTCIDIIRSMSLIVANSLEEAVDRFDTVYAAGQHLLKRSRTTMPRKSLTPLKIEYATAAWEKMPNLEKRLTKAVKETLALLPDKFQPVAKRCEFTLLLTTDAAVQRLNHDWRGKDKPTNVLSFPQFSPKILAHLGAGATTAYIGDVAIARQTVLKEAKRDGKEPLDHLTHLVIHSVLHLFGYDHLTDKDATRMEKIEIKIMATLGLDNPYEAA